LLLHRKKKFAEERKRPEGEERESRGGCLVELVFVVVYRLGLLLSLPEKAAVKRWRESCRRLTGKKGKWKQGEAGFL
jgi:hypothetical protein